MSPAQEWTGRDATALRKALRMTEDRFARNLGVAPRSVANWAARPAMIPRPGVQLILDEMLGRSAPAAKVRFEELTAGARADVARHAQALRVAIAVVIHEDAVLLTRRRDDGAGIAWSFPAGIVKPGEDASHVAVRETLAETGVHCVATEHVGGRLHPVTGVLCDYFRCTYLAGEPANLDTVENAAVTWAPRASLGTFINPPDIYAPVLMILEERHDAAAIR